MLQRTLPAGFIAPCLPTKTDRLPSGTEWLHEIKHDGFRVIARKTGVQVRLYSRHGNDLTPGRSSIGSLRGISISWPGACRTGKTARRCWVWLRNVTG